MIKFLLFVILSILLFTASGIFSEETSVNYIIDESSDAIQKKKSHKWLIPVGAAAGFGLGLLAGFSAFDESINSDAKIWTTAAVCAAAGGLLGWLFAHHMDQPEHMRISMQPNPNLNPSPHFICTHQGSQLMQQVDCMYPDYLRMGL